MTFPWRDCANNRYAPRLGRVHGTRNEEVEVESGSKRVERRVHSLAPFFLTPRKANADSFRSRAPASHTKFDPLDPDRFSN